MSIEVHTQAELDEAVLKYPNGEQGIVLMGLGPWKFNGSSQPLVETHGSSQPLVETHGSSHPLVETYGSSQPRVVTYGSSQPLVVTHGSSQPLVETHGSSQPRVETHGSSQPRVVTYDSSQPRVRALEISSPRVIRRGGTVTVTVAPSAHVTLSGDWKGPVPKGAVLLQRPEITSAAEWCDYYGVRVTRGVATLFKAVDDDYSTDRARPAGIFYTPGNRPAAPDWDGGKEECGGGLHFSPSPSAALRFKNDATRFVRCPVNLTEIVVHPDGQYPEKVKAPRVCGRVVEVDRFGDPVTVPEGVA